MPPQVKLRSSDQQMFEVEEDVAFQSLTVKNMSEGLLRCFRNPPWKIANLQLGLTAQTLAWTLRYRCQTFQAKYWQR